MTSMSAWVAWRAGMDQITGDPDQPDGLEFRNQHGRPIKPSGAAPNAPARPPPQPTAICSHPDGGRMDTGQIYFNPPRTYYDGLRQRIQTNSGYLAKTRPALTCTCLPALLECCEAREGSGLTPLPPAAGVQLGPIG